MVQLARTASARCLARLHGLPPASLPLFAEPSRPSVALARFARTIARLDGSANPSGQPAPPRRITVREDPTRQT